VKPLEATKRRKRATSTSCASSAIVRAPLASKEAVAPGSKLLGPTVQGPAGSTTVTRSQCGVPEGQLGEPTSRTTAQLAGNAPASTAASLVGSSGNR
jgi:hypothetical protein